MMEATAMTQRQDQGVWVRSKWQTQTGTTITEIFEMTATCTERHNPFCANDRNVKKIAFMTKILFGESPKAKVQI